ncbi:Hydrogen peroxide-inducible genes activator [bioreactor metagenome]|uniref:Hydrogen peroxide-inducible genes activator n=1 Tax=bioreactor metagenome TaxID=1076179 RepID=A0A645AYG8_9ZZZZ
MNIQQLEYIVAVDRYKHFAKAALSCGVTQPTLSMMVQRLEEELGVEIFDRTKSPVATNPIGEQIIAQAKVILFNVSQLKEISSSNKESVSGELKMGIIPTIAPYLLPKLFTEFRENLPDLKCKVSEMRTATIIEKLKSADIDIAILSTPLDEPSILEIPVYYEKFLIYVSPGEELFKKDKISENDLKPQSMWILQEGHCFRTQILNICHQDTGSMQQYEAGSIETLINVVDQNGGYTLIPELHVASLSEKQKKNIREFSGYEPRREISIVFRQDFVKERLLNEIVASIKEIIPKQMIDQRLSKFRVKL